MTELKLVHPQPMTSLVASARRLTQKDLQHTRAGKKPLTAGWQEDAWEMFDLVGEQRFLANTLAGRMAQAHLYVGEITDDPTEAPVPVTDPELQSVLEVFGGTPAGRGQLLLRLAINLFVAGEGWLAGIPTWKLPASMGGGGDGGDGIDIADLQWRMLSISEVSTNISGEVTIKLAADVTITTSPDDVYLIRVWRPHPRKGWEADSPTRSSLPVLREIVGLTMHVGAQVDSRLAGAGMLLVPQSAQQALRAAAGRDDNDDTDEFTEAFIEAMVTPISDRASASAVVPLVVTVPDDAVDKFRFMSFGQPLDEKARDLRDESIRRLALGQDAPPELLLGVGSMNHWGAWLVREDTVTTHLEPPLALICDAFTSQYLWPVLEAQDMDEARIRRLVVWYDVSHMIVRPNRSGDALTLFDRGELAGSSLREATGFGDSDAPKLAGDLDDVAAEGLSLAMAHPALFTNPGLPALVAQLRSVYEGTPAPPVMTRGQVVTQPADVVPADGPPATADAPPGVAASGIPPTVSIDRGIRDE